MGMSLRIVHLVLSSYSRQFLARTIVKACLLVLLAEAIYLSQRFTSLLNILIDQGANLFRIIPLLASVSPELYLALPLAVMIATYWAALRSREERELIALASGGQSIVPLIRAAMILATLTFVVSSTVSGFINPYAHFWFRWTRDTIRYESLRTGSLRGHFLHFPNYTIYQFPEANADTDHALFIKEIVSDSHYKIINADRSELITADRDPSITVRLLGVTVNKFPNPNEPWIANDADQTPNSADLTCNDCRNGVTSLKTPLITKDIDIKGLVHSGPRGIALDEWTTPELFGLTSPPIIQDKTQAMVEGNKRLTRAGLCFLAPFVSLLALVYTTRRSRLFALPFACAAIMCGDIAATYLIAKLAANTAMLSLSAVLMTTMMLMILLIRQIVARQNLVIFPALGRS